MVSYYFNWYLAALKFMQCWDRLLITSNLGSIIFGHRHIERAVKRLFRYLEAVAEFKILIGKGQWCIAIKITRGALAQNIIKTIAKVEIG